jgi:hypothetical protein
MEKAPSKNPLRLVAKTTALFPRSQTLFGNGLVGETQFRSGAARGADREGNRIADKAVGEGGRLNCQDNGVPKQSLGTRLKGLCINDN